MKADIGWLQKLSSARPLAAFDTASTLRRTNGEEILGVRVVERRLK
jgi:hypothetical protein